ncbi:c-type cytochrome [Alkalicoccobacillus porphyridii]|uniref:Cytochrome c n=1 Tax=Alkalicoccobacillus porphyridii TaxID=2597270 RepID=A0A553ZZ84_9BACI|nr:cytochrome c [Alkalicoccobacillus porphyridii]TSB46745.1 cytochrome c [Alkalicoccobacillus porphyridii]
MKGSPLIPFALIALIGILLMAGLSAYGLFERNAAEEGENGAEEEVTEIEDPIAAGEEMAQASCINCHGGDLAGAAGPAINNLDGQYTVEQISEIIQVGIGSMPPQTQYDPAEADAIAEYLLSISE